MSCKPKESGHKKELSSKMGRLKLAINREKQAETELDEAWSKLTEKTAEIQEQEKRL